MTIWRKTLKVVCREKTKQGLVYVRVAPVATNVEQMIKLTPTMKQLQRHLAQ